MSNGMPSMTALLGMLALAGYQNRDKLSELLKGAQSSGTQSGPGQASPLGGLLGSIGGVLGGGGAVGFLTEVLGNCLRGLSRTDMAMRRNPGSTPVQTRKFRLQSLSRQSVPTFLRHWKNRRAFRKKSY
jgi:hypothetical protein